MCAFIGLCVCVCVCCVCMCLIGVLARKKIHKNNKDNVKKTQLQTDQRHENRRQQPPLPMPLGQPDAVRAPAMRDIEANSYSPRKQGIVEAGTHTGEGG